MDWRRIGLVLLGVLVHGLLWTGLLRLLGVPMELGLEWIAVMSLWVAAEGLSRADEAQSDPGDTASWLGIASVLGALVLGLLTARVDGVHHGARMPALLLVAAGAFIRAWAVAALGSAFRARAGLSGSPLRRGPYALMRHPAELGLMLCVLGSGLFLASGWAVVVGLTVFPVVTHWRVLAEERALLEAGTPGYEAYLREVPRWGVAWGTKKPSQRL